MGTYVQYGGGLYAPDGWLNYDASPSLRIRKIPLIGKSLCKVPFEDRVLYGDICKGLPVADGSADAVYCSHTLEHLSLEDCRLALKNTLRMMRSGAVFRLVLPDIRAMAVQYLASKSPEAAIVFVNRTGLGTLTRPAGLSGMLRLAMGNASHLWMWDYESLHEELAKAGFGSIRRAEFGDSGDPIFDRVEEKQRWVDDAAGIQCCRP